MNQITTTMESPVLIHLFSWSDWDLLLLDAVQPAERHLRHCDHG